MAKVELALVRRKRNEARSGRDVVAWGMTTSQGKGGGQG